MCPFPRQRWASWLAAALLAACACASSARMASAQELELPVPKAVIYPGDVISGGTAKGTAADSSARLPDGTAAPERFLKTGDVVVHSSPVIGELQARIVPKR